MATAQVTIQESPPTTDDVRAARRAAWLDANRTTFQARACLRVSGCGNGPLARRRMNVARALAGWP